MTTVTPLRCGTPVVPPSVCTALPYGGQLFELAQHKPPCPRCLSPPRSGTAYTVWPVMWTYLNQKGLKQVDEEAALALCRKGAVIVDVRLAADYKVRCGAAVTAVGVGCS